MEAEEKEKEKEEGFPEELEAAGEDNVKDKEGGEREGAEE